MKKFSAEKIGAVLAASGNAVYVPANIAKDVVEFVRYEEDTDINLEACKTTKSPKDLLFPQWENLMHFRMEGKKIELTEQARQDEDFVIFGVRACDIKAFEVLDKVFLADPVDTYYAARRAHGIIVGLACENPEASCFCTNFGVDPAMPNADIVLWKKDGTYFAESYTDKGAALMANWNLEDADAAAVEPIKAEIAEKAAAQPFAKLNLSRFNGDNTNELFKSPKWKKLSAPCLGCGSCTFVCPTCQCYDIRDYKTGHGIERYRCWDSCMYHDFTLMAAETPRPTQVERYRQRFMHKLVYFPANNDGMYSCVGCGRCVEKCPMNLNIVKVIKAIGEEE